ncbi:hypothetical protein CIK69_03010 [Brachybacterium alimentarium]|uniref:Uncharacterized protein n=1 Tax=Brachybacterium alimentarium TaxID=47845 RepID=A0A2A3YLE1_9MICO|nr:hypothetical protein CIK66_05620 [Brachybacterium alimentarium]RCS87423.1 hypothetical protein CIK67_02935 [Brachybacterium alimentarium]RCS93206.1 hypothetical protein CIK69_03010 [Brachybacterium alimentarium]
MSRKEPKRLLSTLRRVLVHAREVSRIGSWEVGRGARRAVSGVGPLGIPAAITDRRLAASVARGVGDDIGRRIGPGTLLPFGAGGDPARESGSGHGGEQSSGHAGTFQLCNGSP